MQILLVIIFSNKEGTGRSLFDGSGELATLGSKVLANKRQYLISVLSLHATLLVSTHLLLNLCHDFLDSLQLLCVVREECRSILCSSIVALCIKLRGVVGSED